MEHITLIMTGGTIDKVYGRGKGIRDPLHIGRGAAFDLFNKMELNSVLTFHPRAVCTKDSLDITDKDRQTIVRACVEANTSKIIITHGTDTIVKTAEALRGAVQPRRTVVLTGAALPACMKDTDAEFNLGLALGACLFAPAGIYIALNGVHPWYRCVKASGTGVFVPV